MTSNSPTVHSPSTLELIKTCADTTTTQLSTVLQLETSPFTQNTHYFTDCRDGWLAKYKDARAGKGAAERITPASVPPTQVFSFTQPGTSKEPERARTSAGESLPKSPRPIAKKLKVRQKPAAAHHGRVPFGSFSTPVDRESERSDDASGTEDTPTPTTNAFDFSNLTTTSSHFDATAEDQAKRQELIQETLANLTRLGYQGVKEDDLGKLNPPDIYEDELHVMAEVRAYFQVAYKVCELPLALRTPATGFRMGSVTLRLSAHPGGCT